MGLLDKIKDALTATNLPPDRPAFHVQGGGQRQIAGAPHYPTGFNAVVHRGTKERARYHFTARVVTSPDNPHDPNAVAIYYGRLQLGHLSAKQAAEWHDSIAQIEVAGFEVHADAAVVSGFHGGTWGGFVRLPKPGPLLTQFEKVRAP